MCISGAEFEEHCFSILEMFSIECCTILVEPLMMSSLSSFAWCEGVNISEMEEGYSRGEDAVLLCFEKPFKYTAVVFYFIGMLW